MEILGDKTDLLGQKKDFCLIVKRNIRGLCVYILLPVY